MTTDCNVQENVYNLIINEIKSGHISHAYLIDENGNMDAYNMVLSFIKEILCLNLDEKGKTAVCKRIDDGNYPELKIIKPDGMLIKKQQILDLQKEFSMMAVEGSKRIYVIRECEKMRPETANSMLKFLEEPESDIVAFLMTNNINNILSTIISRCQIIRLGNKICSNNVSDVDDIALEFIDNVERLGKKSIIGINKVLFDKISSKDREKLVSFFDKVIDMYYDIMKFVIGDVNKDDMLYYDRLVKYVDNNDFKGILNKINYLVAAKDSIKFNVNCSLLIDSLILNIGG